MAPQPPRKRRVVLPAAALAIALLVIAAIVGLIRRSPRADADAKLQTIAVMPFTSLGGDGARDYLRLALPNEIITILTYNHALSVRPFASSSRFADRDPQEVGKALNVTNVLTGNFRDEVSGVNVTVEDVDAERDRVVWRESLTFPHGDLISGRNELSTRIRQGLFAALGVTATTVSSDRPTNPDAYALYLQALGVSHDPGPNQQALPMIRQAVALDPSFASGWSELGRREYDFSRYGRGGAAAMRRSEAATDRALSLDPDLISAARSRIVNETERTEYTAARRHAADILQRRPRSADAHFALSYLLRYTGQLQESARECDIAYSIDASSSLRSCATTFLDLGDFQRARTFIALDGGTTWAQQVEALVSIHENRAAAAPAVVKPLSTTAPVLRTLLSACASETRIAASEIQPSITILFWSGCATVPLTLGCVKRQSGCTNDSRPKSADKPPQRMPESHGLATIGGNPIWNTTGSGEVRESQLMERRSTRGR